jgi:hypothetical protein
MMYQSLVSKSPVQVVNNTVSQFAIQSGPDGLVVDTSGFKLPGHAAMPDRLRRWLGDLRLLRNVPLAYMVADSALLTPESIRFFHVDLTWIDRIIDGVFSAADTGSVDLTYSCGMLQLVRNLLDQDLITLAKSQVPGATWNPATSPMTGMLIRSDLVRRWPDMIVQAYTAAVDRQHTQTDPTIATLRCEPVSKDILIALFAGQPGLVTVREPHVGVRFGVEDKNTGSHTGPYQVPVLDIHGVEQNVPEINILLRNRRVLNIGDLSSKVMLPGGGRSRMVAMHLQRKAYVQQFLTTVNESTGWKTLFSFRLADGSFQKVVLSGGGVLNLENLASRMTQLNLAEKS